MKILRLLSVTLVSVALLGGSALAAEKKDKEPCCKAATVEAQKDCACACCKKAAEKGKWCKQCHPDKAKEKKDKK